MYKQIEISFGETVKLPHGWRETFEYALFMAMRAGDKWEIGYNGRDARKESVHSIDATCAHGLGFDFPPGFDRLLDSLVDMACKAYDKANPTMHMWPAGHGSRPIWSKQDASFLGKAAEADAPDDGEPTWDDSTYQISCSVQEDTHGHNEWNPKREAIREAMSLERKRKKLDATRIVEISRVLDEDQLYHIRLNKPLTDEQFKAWQEELK